MTQQKLGHVKIAATSSPPNETPVKVGMVERRRMMGDEKLNDVKVTVCYGSEQRRGAAPVHDEWVDAFVGKKMLDHMSVSGPRRQEERKNQDQRLSIRQDRIRRLLTDDIHRQGDVVTRDLGEHGRINNT